MYKRPDDLRIILRAAMFDLRLLMHQRRGWLDSAGA
jgi:hypothetical protein